MDPESHMNSSVVELAEHLAFFFFFFFQYFMSLRRQFFPL